PSPFPYANIVTSTTQKSLRGPRGGFILCDEDLARKVDFAVFPFTQGGPLMQAIAGKAVCFGQALKPEFSRYAHQVVANCKVLASELSEAGMRLVSGGTDNHMVLVDVTPLGITGQQAEQTLESVGIIANKNAIPFDPQPPRVTSGLRLGTPAITSRGMTETEVKQVAGMLTRVLLDLEDKETHAKVLIEVKELTSKFEVPGIDN
ncbi:MAG: aminotransferase class I/II-fold pyridoxal phosphate-dependent enzyme, partial [Chloroflexota bacterium]|nr:aminotransferase class I/II-fold pyridoxal phosphate-dependent enzyme [Chloroflexota bacterium]